MALVLRRAHISECCLGDKTIPGTFYGVAIGVENNDWDDDEADDGV